MRQSALAAGRAVGRGGLRATACVWAAVVFGVPAHAQQLQVPNIFGDHMVLQREQENPIWGKAAADAEVSIELAGKSISVRSDAEGNWKGKLPSMPAGGPHKLTVRSGDQSLEVSDILVGEVWICSGQSNMQWTVASSEDFALEKLAADYPQIRMINFPQVGSQTPIYTHDRQWMVAGPETVGSFSAVGYFFGRQLHQTLDVPIGLINNAWGGSAAEAWVDRPTLEQSGKFDQLLARWEKMETRAQELEAKSDRSDAEEKELTGLKKNLSGNHRPANIYNGVLASHLGYGIRGAIWYQGESNASRAYQYRELFPLMISLWRERWGQGDFPFYWVQLADFKDEKSEPGESDWAELREAQTMTLERLSNVGQAVIIDIGEGKDIHPRNKVDVGRRLARLALRNEYGYEVAAESPRFESMQVEGDTAVLSFEDVGKGWRPFDVKDPQGFTVAGEDKKFYEAEAEILKDNRIRVRADEVDNPAAVRYGWADNPVVNLYNQDDLPLTPFRTDEWPGVTADAQ